MYASALSRAATLPYTPPGRGRRASPRRKPGARRSSCRGRHPLRRTRPTPRSRVGWLVTLSLGACGPLDPVCDPGLHGGSRRPSLMVRARPGRSSIAARASSTRPTTSSSSAKSARSSRAAINVFLRRSRDATSGGVVCGVPRPLQRVVRVLRVLSDSTRPMVRPRRCRVC